MTDDPDAPPSGERAPHDGSPPEKRAPIVRISRPMIVLLVTGLIVALLIFWFEPPFTLRYIVCGVLGAIYVFLRFNDWR
jgi:hypothetical protein